MGVLRSDPDAHGYSHVSELLSQLPLTVLTAWCGGSL